MTDMLVKAVLALALLGVAPATAQLSRRTFGGLPRWADSALVAAGLGRQFTLSSQLNPAYEFADQATPPPLEAYRTLAPPESHDLPGLHVYYIHKFTVNGVYLGGRTCFVQETAKLRRVDLVDSVALLDHFLAAH